MLRNKGVSWFLGLAVMLFTAGVFARTGPTVAEIAANWDTMSGGLDAKIVYWDGQDDAVKVIDLVAETETTVVTGIIRTGDYNTPCPCWSPDGL